MTKSLKPDFSQQGYLPYLPELLGIDWASVDVVLLDLDGVFYPETEEYFRTFNRILAQSIQEIARERGCLLGDIETIKRITRQSYFETGSFATYLDEYLEKQFPGMFDFQHTDHELVHHMLHNMHVEHVLETGPYFEECPNRRKFFEMLPDFKDTAILTHSNKNWGMVVANELGYGDLFPEDKVYGLESVDFNRKDESDEAFVRICEDLCVVPERVLFIDNTSANLLYPSQLGMQTVWIQADKPSFDPKPDHITAQCPDLADIEHDYREWQTVRHRPDIESLAQDTHARNKSYTLRTLPGKSK